MKTLFINPPNVPITTSSIWIEPIDVLTIATYVRSLWNEVKVIDMDRRDWMEKELESLLKWWNFDLVVIIYDYHIPLFQDWSQEKLLEIVKICKSYSLKVAVGWKLSTYAPQKLLMSTIYPDVVISKEMEIPLKELLQSYNWNENFLNSISNIAYRLWDWIKINKIEPSNFDISELPIPDRSLLKISEYIDVRTILSSRSCSFGCSFCSVPDFWWKRRVRTAEDVVKEIIYLVKEFGAKKILFLDDNATIETERMREISRLLINLELDVKLGCLWNMRHFDEDTMKLMYGAWFRWIHYWVESGSEELLKSVNKYMPKEQIKKVINQTKKIWFRVRTSLIMDLPWSTPETIKETCKFLLDLEPHEIRIHYLSIRFWSKIFEKTDNTSWLIPKQYIHSKPPVEKGAISEIIEKSISSLINKLQTKNYKPINNIEENAKFDQSYWPDTKIIAFSPLKYWIWWN